MAKKTKNNEVEATLQALSIEGAKVKNVWYKSKKMGRFSLDVIDVTPNGHEIHSFIPCVCFGDCSELEEDEFVSVTGSLFYDVREDEKGKKSYILSVKVGEIEWI